MIDRHELILGRDDWDHNNWVMDRIMFALEMRKDADDDPSSLKSVIRESVIADMDQRLRKYLAEWSADHEPN